MRRVLKYTNAIGAILILAGVGLFYRYIWQSFPQTSGELAVAIAKPATVARDGQGIPHISAASVEDAVYLQGYVHAQDRFWQMEATRRIAAGEMAELVGQTAVESDLLARQLRLRRLANQMVQNMEPEDRVWFAAYARGVNDWLAAHQESLPLEIRLLGYTPRQWQIADSMLLILHMYRQLSNSWTNEFNQTAFLAQATDKEKARELFPTRAGAEITLGSNAWAIAGSRTASGKPILAGDPHLAHSWPSTFHIVHLKGGGLNVIGGSLPGAPGIVIGHNEKIAWSMTNLHFDCQDLYANETRVIGIEREVIRIKGRPDAVVDLRITPNGPLLSHSGMQAAMRWTAFEGKYPLAFRQLNMAQNWQEFRAALSRFAGPAHNFIYADTSGNIGYQAAGHMPIRKTAESGVVLDAQNPEHQWQGFIPFEELPTAFNPSSAELITANQNPFPKDYKHPVAGTFTPPYRQRQIHQRLAAKPKWQPAEMTSVQMDVYSAFHHFLAGQLVAAGKSRKSTREDFSTALELLAAWDGRLEINQAAPVIASMAYEHLKLAVARRVAPASAGLESQFAPTVVERLLRERPKDWFRDYDQLLVQSLLDALDEGGNQQGKNPRYWDYGRYHRLTVPNLVLAEAVTVGKFVTPAWMPFASYLRTLRVPFIDGYVQAGPVPLSGGTLTVKQATQRIAPAFRFVADLGNWDNSLMTITLGESGHAMSPHGKDYWDAWLNGGAIALPFENIKAEATLSLRPR